jgi:hypothetical protein
LAGSNLGTGRPCVVSPRLTQVVSKLLLLFARHLPELLPQSRLICMDIVYVRRTSRSGPRMRSGVRVTESEAKISGPAVPRILTRFRLGLPHGSRSMTRAMLLTPSSHLLFPRLRARQTVMVDSTSSVFGKATAPSSTAGPNHYFNPATPLRDNSWGRHRYLARRCLCRRDVKRNGKQGGLVWRRDDSLIPYPWT